jgi:cation transport regulator ChaC
VVTLLPARGVICKGAAYLVEPSVFKHLDHREKNGYRQMPTEITFDCGSSVAGVVYVADRHNPAFLGDAPITDVAAQIAASHGPSGSNRDYLLQLAAALRELGDGDTHVQALEALLRQSS